MPTRFRKRLRRRRVDNLWGSGAPPIAVAATPRRYAAAMATLLARTVSILGHPLLVLPAAVLLLAVGDADAPRRVWPIAIAMAVLAAAVMGYSWWKVRSGRWTHVDASGREERRSLNRFLLPALAGGGLAAWFSGAHAFGLGLGVSALLVAAAMACARWCKLSLHLAFALFASLLLWHVSPWAGTAALALAGLLAWSRLALGRHAPRDLVMGTIAGTCAGLLFWRLAALADLPSAVGG